MSATPIGTIGTAHSSGTVGSLVITVGASGVGSGHSILIGGAAGGTAVISSVSDSKGNTYAVDKTQLNGTSITASIASAHNVAALANGDTITVNFSGSQNVAVCAFEVSGLKSSGAFDQAAGGANTGTSPATSATATTAQADELLWGVVAYQSTSTWTQGSGYTDGPTDASTTTVRTLHTEYRVVAATGTYIADGAMGTSRAWAAAIATYKAAASGLKSHPGMDGGMRDLRGGMRG